MSICSRKSRITVSTTGSFLIAGHSLHVARTNEEFDGLIVFLPDTETERRRISPDARSFGKFLLSMEIKAYSSELNCVSTSASGSSCDMLSMSLPYS